MSRDATATAPVLASLIEPTVTVGLTARTAVAREWLSPPTTGRT